MRLHHGSLTRTSAASAVAAALLLLTGCSDGVDNEGSTDGEDAVETTPTTDAGTDTGEAIAFEEIAADYETYVGQDVTVDAEVDEVLGDVAFTIAGVEDKTIDPLLVLVTDENTALADDLVADGDPVTVTGTVEEEFSTTEVEEELGFDIDDEELSGYEGARYLVATDLSVGDEGSDAL